MHYPSHKAITRCAHILVALALPAHRQSRVHVQVVRGKIQTYEELEDHAPARFRRREEDKQARGRAPVGYHVQYCAEAGGLAEIARGPAIESVEETADGVEEAAAARVEGHVVEGG